MSHENFEKLRASHRERVFDVVMGLIEKMNPLDFKAFALAALDAVAFSLAYTGMSTKTFQSLASESFKSGAKLAERVLTTKPSAGIIGLALGGRSSPSGQ